MGAAGAQIAIVYSATATLVTSELCCWLAGAAGRAGPVGHGHGHTLHTHALHCTCLSCRCHVLHWPVQPGWLHWSTWHLQERQVQCSALSELLPFSLSIYDVNKNYLHCGCV
jgi:hypothetical protein